MLLGARQLFDESDKVKTGYVFNKYNNTFKDEDGVISGFKDRDTRDSVFFQSLRTASIFLFSIYLPPRLLFQYMHVKNIFQGTFSCF